eukprot:385553-Rhodomonas_salina.1
MVIPGTRDLGSEDPSLRLVLVTVMVTFTMIWTRIDCWETLNRYLLFSPDSDTTSSVRNSDWAAAFRPRCGILIDSYYY